MGRIENREMATSTNQRVRSRIKVITDCVKLETELSKAGDRLVVLEFFSSSVSPCRKIQDDIAALSLEHTGAVFLKINLDFWEVSSCAGAAAMSESSLLCRKSTIYYRGSTHAPEVIISMTPTRIHSSIHPKSW